MKAVRQAFLVFLMTIVVILMVQNAQPIKFRFLNWEYDVSQLLLVIIVLTIGFLSGYVTAKLASRKKVDEPLPQTRR